MRALVLTEGKPIYKQIVEQVLRQIKAGDLRPGDRLPTERELAAQLQVARGTVQKAYRELSDNNIVEIIQGSGCYVYNDRDVYDVERRKLALELLGGAIEKMESWNLSDKEIAALFRMTMARRQPAETLVRIALVDCNPESLAIFKRQLSYIPGIVASVFLVDTILMDDDPARLLSDYDLILTTITHYEALAQCLKPGGLSPVPVDVSPSRQTTVNISTLPERCALGIVCQSNKFANLITQQLALFRGESDTVPVYFETDVQQSIRFMQRFDAVIVSPDLPLLDPAIAGDALERYTAAGKRVIPFDYLIDRAIHVEELVDQLLVQKQSGEKTS